MSKKFVLNLLVITLISLIVATECVEAATIVMVIGRDQLHANMSTDQITPITCAEIAMLVDIRDNDKEEIKQIRSTDHQKELVNEHFIQNINKKIQISTQIS